ncbi:ABC transporter ATP-binding protein [Caldilinea sp.]|uniref:ABC transporter ATP-binding protein n=1 Tax=Caldilinea sp. TaxID=2293560 RepID=UPI0021DE48B6|nr:ABC transporter ATP-binding protein [Caldilinea sp.]GIV71344.1 MAG: multidrug ABC transporter ATP-binding protein [Caldilinea sp.]
MTQNTGGAANPIRLGMGGAGRLSGDSARDTRSTLVRLGRYLRPYAGRLLLVTALVIVGALLSLSGPILLGRAIDQSVIPRDLAGLGRMALLMLAVYAGAGLAAALQGLLMVNIGQHLVADIRAALFSHLQRLSMSYHDRHRTGDLMSRLSNDTEAINSVLSNGLIDFTTNILSLGGIIIAMYILNWPLALAMSVLLPLMLFITTLVTRYSRRAFRNVQRNLGGLNAVMEENIAGIRAVKAFAREETAIARFQEANAANRAAGIKADIITAALGPMFTTMSTITIAITALLGGWLALRGVVQVGVLATFVIYIMNFFQPMRGIAMVYNSLQSALAGAERIFEVLDAEPDVSDLPGAKSLENLRGHVRFDHVTFSYEPGKPVLIDVSLEASPGQTIALVGPTGAGKTTIISLLSRFYDVDQGAIYIDGHDIRTVQQASLRKQLGIVLQDTFLFSGTVMDNIRYGRLDATDEEVIAAAKLANADRFIRLLPEGYRTHVSEQGHNFSQGQRQLLAIARAILADPRILILDEATSSVDTRTEMQIQEALLRLMRGRTSFVIAHRLSTIRNADQVLVVNDHRIIERGSHEELLARKGFYYELYMSQFRRFETALAQAQREPAG